MELNVEGRRGRERSKKWLSRIEYDMRTAGVCVNDVGDQFFNNLLFTFKKNFKFIDKDVVY